ncbi:hypothetical protein LCM00_21235 [Bacillus infantis]|uniref:hypothetical protein n=1 Tax=Bacillus infantis TaxID=324767 RepID=UPI001CD3E2B2|nr:hypothetical protein [Bacillus infantis]MCA1042025.1 hypothetical protein [Bacillus infantis]
MMTGSYEHRLVAFLDILGFSALVSKSVLDPEYAKLLHGALEGIQHFVQHNEEKKLKENSSVEMVQFSDSLVISAPYIDTVSFNTFIMNINFIQKILARSGILIRGGISAGPLYHRGTIAYGPAFIKAYKLESELANYPRIVIDPQIMSNIIRPANESVEDTQFFMEFHQFVGNTNPIVLKDFDDVYFVNYLYGMYREEGIAESLKEYITAELRLLDPNEIGGIKVINKLKWTLKYIESMN